LAVPDASPPSPVSQVDVRNPPMIIGPSAYGEMIDEICPDEPYEFKSYMPQFTKIGFVPLTFLKPTHG
jgi:hypothetical protein